MGRDWLSVRDTIGMACDGVAVSGDELALVIAAMRGTLRLGPHEHLFYADVDTAALSNVDTAECIWHAPPDGAIPGNRPGSFSRDEDCVRARMVPLAALADPVRMQRLERLWESTCDEEGRAAWSAFVVRIAGPLRRLLDSAVGGTRGRHG